MHDTRVSSMLPPGLPVHLHDSSSRSSPRPKKKSHSRIPWNPYPPSVTTAKRLRILFYHKHEPHFGFTNFSNHPVGYKGVMYPTSGHLFQCLKFLPDRPDLAHHILNCSRPSVALSEARRYQPAVRPDWKQVNLKMMDETLWLKFTQHPELMNELLATGNAELIENSDKDSFWGVGVDGRGQNHLGKALERLRDKLRKMR